MASLSRRSLSRRSLSLIRHLLNKNSSSLIQPFSRISLSRSTKAEDNTNWIEQKFQIIENQVRMRTTKNLVLGMQNEIREDIIEVAKHHWDILPN